MPYAIVKNWRYKLQIRRCDTWKKYLERIEDEALRIKVACIAWWDFSGVKHQKWGLPPNNYLRMMQDKYHWYMDEYINEKDLEDALFMVGYSRLEAKRRSIEPKNGR